jgi:phospholipid/cholesterol/gamma-HCH transport system permease protein
MAMVAMADFTEEQGAHGTTLRFTGRLTLARVGDLPKRLADRNYTPEVIDLSSLERIDTVGAWIVHKLTLETGATVVGASPEALRLIDLVDETGIDVKMRPEAQNPFVRVLGEIGAATTDVFHTLYGLLSFFGAIMIATGTMLRHPSRLRINAIIQRFELVGVRALGIVGLMSFLIGIVIAQQGADQLADYGAQDMTVNLVARLTLRELGVLMTAIMVAGRSGSAFAAQIGTMKLTEEIDAMRTIGISPIEALVMPRVIAAILMMPLLGFFATFTAILGGGLFCWMSLDISPTTFVQRIQLETPLHDVWVGMIKAPVFGAIIAMTGCFQGMQVKGNAEEVGLRTTAAVVQAIFIVIVLDAFFAVFFSSIGWD